MSRSGKPVRWGALTIIDEVKLGGGLCTTQFAALVLRDGIPHTVFTEWPTVATDLEEVLAPGGHQSAGGVQ